MKEGEPRYRLTFFDGTGECGVIFGSNLDRFVGVIGAERNPAKAQMKIKSGKKELFSEDMIDKSEKIKNAFELARTYHQGQTRKVGGAPAIEHILDTTRMLWEAGFDEDVVAAGFGHDLLEDTNCTAEEIGRSCGTEVLRIIQAVSNDPEIREEFGWKAVKKHYIETVQDAGPKAIAVCVADKISNLSELLEQFYVHGPSIWEYFNAPPEDKLWFEKEVLAMAKANWDHPMIGQYETLVRRFEEIVASHASR